MDSKRLKFTKDLALKTGELLLEKFNHHDRQGTLKDDRTLVTEADRAADQLIMESIQKAYPKEGILSEESSTTLPPGEDVWVVDPLDGTVNFSRGLNYWGVSIAHLREGSPYTAALYFPVTGELFSASKNEGAYLNGEVLGAGGDFDQDLFPLFMHCSRMHQKYQVDLPYKKRSLGAAAYHLCLIASSTAVLSFESTVRIWDFAAAWLVVREAGGMITSLGDEAPFPAQTGRDYHKVPFPIAAAISKDVLDTARQNIIRMK